MPVFRLTKKLLFPPPELANEDGMVAIGGDLSVERLLLAYYNGIFPWFSEGEPILWWSPDPRFVLFPQDIKVSKSMRKCIRKGLYEVTFDKCFRDVVSFCGSLRTDGTWITKSMLEAYCKLHEAGYAHSVETWYREELVGGLYGVSLGRCFFGESMFSFMDNASKMALITLAGRLSEKKFHLIDCQVYTKHLESMGAVNIPRREFLEHLEKGLAGKTLCGNWGGFTSLP